MATLRAIFASLAIRNYRLFFFGQLISLTGSWAQTIAQDWLVLELTDNSPTALATVTALQFAPTLLLTLYAGLLADRCDRRTLLIVVASGLALAAALMALLVLSGSVQLWQVYVFALITGIGGAFEKPIRQTFVPQLVPAAQVRNAVSLNAAVFNSARLVGPAAGGLSIAVAGIGTTFAMNALSFGAVVMSLVLLRRAELVPVTPIGRRPGQLREGIAFLVGRRDLRQVVVMGMIVGGLALNLNQLLALRARVDFHASSAQFGLLSSALAVGALLGALFGARHAGRPPAGLQFGTAAAFGASLLVIAAVPSYVATMVLLIPAGAAWIGHNTVANARIQLGTPAELRGRVMSIYVMVFFGAVPLGSALLGGVAGFAGPQAALATLGGGVLAGASMLGAPLLRRRPAAREIAMIEAKTAKVDDKSGILEFAGESMK